LTINRFPNWQLPEIKHGVETKYGWKVYNPENFKLGKNTDIGDGVRIFAKYGVEIEEDAQVGGGTFIYSINTENDTHSKIIIMRGAKIGANCVILPSKDGKPRIIGENASVRANTTVNKNIPRGFKYP